MDDELYSCSDDRKVNPQISPHTQIDVKNEFMLKEEATIFEASNEPSKVCLSVASQTPLTLAKFTMIKPSATNVNPAYNEGCRFWGKAISQGKLHDSFPGKSDLRLKEMPFKLRQEATTQATPPHPSMMAKTSPKRNPGSNEILPKVTPISSSGSTPRSEILTVTTDYDYVIRTTDLPNSLIDSNMNSEPLRFAQDEHNQGAKDTERYKGNETSHPGIRETPEGPMTSDFPAETRSLDLTNLARRNRLSIKNWLPCISSSLNQHGSSPHPSGAPPSYSSIYLTPTSRSNGRRLPALLQGNSSSFVAPIPPPSYAQSQGVYVTSYPVNRSISPSPSEEIWSPHPITIVCPRCVSFVVTIVETRIPLAAHVAAILLCLCGCWPCCMVPYCIDSCRIADHYCPVCHTYLGTFERF